MTATGTDANAGQLVSNKNTRKFRTGYSIYHYRQPQRREVVLPFVFPQYTEPVVSESFAAEETSSQPYLVAIV